MIGLMQSACLPSCLPAVQNDWWPREMIAGCSLPPVRWPMVRTRPGSGRRILWCDSKVTEFQVFRSQRTGARART
jgi:hypothetical protein